MIIGLTGTMGAGKGEVSSYLQKKGFKYISISDIIREEIKKRNRPFRREELQNLGNELRKEHGEGYWAKIVCEKIDVRQKWIIDSIRNPGEIEELKKIPNFFLIGIDAPRETRLRRARKRKRVHDGRLSTDPLSEEELKKVESRDRGVNEPEYGQQVLKCIERADFKIMNETSLEALYEKIEDILMKMYPKRSMLK